MTASGGGAVGVVAVSPLPVSFLLSFLLVSAAGAVTSSAGLVSAGFSVVFSVVFGSVALGASVPGALGTDAVASSLKSSMVGGGRFAGSGSGIAASIASSAALLRAGLACASAEVADTVRKVAATVISTRSNPARFFNRSRILTPPWANCPAWNSSQYRPSQVSLKRRAFGLATHSVNIWSASECAPNESCYACMQRSYAD